jgi:hypothetical protein
MPVQVNGLDETLKAIEYVTTIVERATGATAVEKGQSEIGVQTLGEIQMLAGKASERAKTMSKFYKHSWYRLSKKWDAMMQANSFPTMTLYKTGIDGKVYPKKVNNKDWKSEAGYEPTIASSSEQEADDIKSIQKFQFVAAQFPENQALKRIAQQRQLKLLDLTSAELAEVQEEQRKAQKMAEQQALMQPQVDQNGKPVQQQPGAQPAGTPPGDPALQASIQDSLQQLGQMMG